MPTVLILFGLKFRIYVRDHQPPHIHVISQDGEARFSIDGEITMLSNKGVKPKDIKLAEMVIEENREIIITAWVKIYGE